MVDSNDLTGSATLYVVVVVAAVLIGTVLAPVAWSASAGGAEEEQRPAVAVITISGSINANNVEQISEDLRQARQNDSVKAVVLKVDSPGGAATASEQLYLAVNRTAQEMPVVAAVTGVSASGSYYGIMPADAIYVTPASVVGSVGVFAQVGIQPDGVPNSIVRSGPDKATLTRDQVQNQVETLQNSFVSTVMKHRGDQLELSRQEVSSARTYTGARAIRNGMADEVGGVESAVYRAAQLSDQIEGDNYDVYYKEPPTTGFGIILGQTDQGQTIVSESGFGHEGVNTAVQYYALWGTVEDEDDETEVIINATG